MPEDEVKSQVVWREFSVPWGLVEQKCRFEWRLGRVVFGEVVEESWSPNLLPPTVARRMGNVLLVGLCCDGGVGL